MPLPNLTKTHERETPVCAHCHTLAWFERWLKGYTARLLSPTIFTPHGDAATDALLGSGFRSAASNEVARALDTDQRNDLHTVGFFASTVAFSGPAGGNEPLTSAGTEDLFVVKTALDGAA